MPDFHQFKSGRNPFSGLLFFICLLAAPLSAGEAGVDEQEEFARIMVLDKGRIKPLDTYARSLLLQFSGRKSYNRKPAIHWLARVFFTPEETRKDNIFMVNDMQVIEAMGLTLEDSRRFSYEQLLPGLKKLRELAGRTNKIDEKERTRVEAELLRLYYNIDRYISITSSFRFAVPHKEFSIKSEELALVMGLQSAPEKHSFFEIAANAEKLVKFIDLPGRDTAQLMSKDEIEAVRLHKTLSQWLKFHSNMPITILPVQEHGSDIWASPWDVLQNHVLARSFAGELQELSHLARAYFEYDQEGFNAACKAFTGSIEKRIRGSRLASKINIELKYNHYHLFLWSKMLYGLSLIIALSALAGWGKLLSRIGLMLLAAALIPHSLGIVLRMLIMDRPPVTNLYETFLFVGWMGAVLGLVIEILQRKTVGLISAGFTGLAMLMIAEKYALEGDTLGMLVAVLDSNFWLTTHVVTITMGYAGCCAAGVAGHVYILQELFSLNREKLKETGRTVYGVMAFGLIFSFIGTVLGGIWADQSWGRFWGWDPKENGALLIVLWCCILFHARLGGIIKGLGMAIGSVIGVIVVMFAWFGVNLLGVGLHSYGFSSGAGRNLLVYTLVETGFLLVCAWFILQKKYRSKLIQKLEKG